MNPQNVTELVQTLVRIPSVNPDGDAGIDQPGEKECAEFVRAFLQHCGAGVELVEVLPQRPNVIGRFGSDRPDKPRLVLAPHTDTVSVAGMKVDPFGGELRGGKIFGRGASDTKGTMAAMLWALYELRESIADLGAEIWFAGLIGEEAGQHGAHHFVAHHKADFALIGEPTNLDIVHTHKGSAWLTIRTHGFAAHSSRPELGENAIVKMLPLLHWIRTGLAEEFSRMHDAAVGSPTVSIGTIRGGTKTNVVPDLCEVTVDIRTIPSQDTDAFGDELIARLAAICPDADFAINPARPLFTEPANPFIEKLEQAGGKCVGAPWFCDAAVFSAAGIPAVAAGPGSIEQAHTEDEWIAVDELERGVEFYKKFLLSL